MSKPYSPPNSRNEFVVVYQPDRTKDEIKEEKPKISDKITEIDINQEKNKIENSKENQIIKNQVKPFVRTNLEVNRMSSFYTTCQHCQQKVMTRSIQSFNSCTCVFCCCTGIVIYALIQIIRGKDICCCDAEHICPNCKETIAIYESCC